ncbi:DUF2303 family protein [Pseudogemmobacter humi]|uniref:DUF2303 family protein n=1 Tax=Pseudogemmobacter humi TaxID=2483812 RepID=A0A3P5WYF7_9RHOB|nr:DUF2303 family protein [Pseudogemmobacter humi]VDC28254.1 hypothetical protein XINFAN_02029 [Pseudogemmobacter humi]
MAPENPTAEPLAELTIQTGFDIRNPGETLETILRGARLADPILEGPDGRKYATLPKEFTLRELEDDARLDPFPRQRVTVDDRASLSAYANRYSDSRSIIIADYDALTISARLDWHHHNQDSDQALRTGPNEHSATLKLRPSEEFMRWDAFVQKGFHDQETFARFLEENSCDVHLPDPATLIEISRDFEATVGQTYKSSTRLDNGDRKIFFESDSRATHDVIVPQKITLRIPFYNGEQPSDIEARFRWRAASGAVQFRLEWHRVEYHRRAHFTEIAYTASEETGLPVFIGREG